MCRLLWAVALVSASTVVFAQNAKPPVTLEAAAVKAAPPDMPPLVPGNWAPPTSSSARLRPMTLRTLVMYAFDIVPRRHDPEPVGGPAWFDKTRVPTRIEIQRRADRSSGTVRNPNKSDSSSAGI